MRSLFSDETRYRNILVLAHVGWWGTVALVGFRTMGLLPQSTGSLALLTLGLGVTASLSLSRLRLADTITAVFQTGLKAATALQANLQTTAAVVEVSLEGKIVQVEHAEALHWSREGLMDQPLDILIPDRFLRAHHAAFEEFRGADESHVAGATLNIPIRGENGTEWPMRLSLTRLGESFIGTVIPSETTEGPNVYEMS